MAYDKINVPPGEKIAMEGGALGRLSTRGQHDSSRGRGDRIE